MCAAHLKRNGHKTIVHALAWESLEAYAYLLALLKHKTPLERIAILLWRDHFQVTRKLEAHGYGTLSPSSLRTFREKYFKTGQLPNPVHIRHKKEAEATLALMHGKKLSDMATTLADIEKRVWPTKIGLRLRKSAFDSLYKSSKLQAQLS